MMRWIALAVAVVLAGAAAWAVLSGAGPSPRPEHAATGAAREAPHGDIDEASRERLEQILREADRDQEQPR